MTDSEMALIIAAYKFAGVPGPERMAAAYKFLVEETHLATSGEPCEPGEISR